MNLTPEQQRVIKGYHGAFGDRAVRARITPRSGGVVHMVVETDAGRWDSNVQPTGELVGCMFTQRMLLDASTRD